MPGCQLSVPNTNVSSMPRLTFLHRGVRGKGNTHSCHLRVFQNSLPPSCLCVKLAYWTLFLDWPPIGLLEIWGMASPSLNNNNWFWRDHSLSSVTSQICPCHVAKLWPLHMLPRHWCSQNNRLGPSQSLWSWLTLPHALASSSEIHDYFLLTMH